MVIENAMVMLKMAVTNWWTFAHQEKTIRDTAKGSLLSSHKLFSLLTSHGIKAKNCTNYSKCRPNICAFKICTVVQMRREATFCAFVYLHVCVSKMFTLCGRASASSCRLSLQTGGRSCQTRTWKASHLKEKRNDRNVNIFGLNSTQLDCWYLSCLLPNETNLVRGCVERTMPWLGQCPFTAFNTPDQQFENDVIRSIAQLQKIKKAIRFQSTSQDQCPTTQLNAIQEQCWISTNSPSVGHRP